MRSGFRLGWDVDENERALVLLVCIVYLVRLCAPAPHTVVDVDIWQVINCLRHLVNITVLPLHIPTYCRELFLIANLKAVLKHSDDTFLL